MKIFGQCRFSWHGLWLLILLLFTNVVATSVSILNCPRLKDRNGKASLVIYTLAIEISSYHHDIHSYVCSLIDK